MKAVKAPLYFIKCLVFCLTLFTNQLALPLLYAEDTPATSTIYNDASSFCLAQENVDDKICSEVKNDSINIGDTKTDPTGNEDRDAMIASQIALFIFIIFGALMPLGCPAGIATWGGGIYFAGTLLFIIEEIVVFNVLKAEFKKKTDDLNANAGKIPESYTRTHYERDSDGSTKVVKGDAGGTYYSGQKDILNNAKKSLDEIDKLLQVRLGFVGAVVGLMAASAVMSVVELVSTLGVGYPTACAGIIVKKNGPTASELYASSMKKLPVSIPLMTAKSVKVDAMKSITQFTKDPATQLRLKKEVEVKMAQFHQMMAKAGEFIFPSAQASGAITGVDEWANYMGLGAGVAGAIVGIIIAIKVGANLLKLAFITSWGRLAVAIASLVPLIVLLVYIVKARDKIKERKEKYDALIRLLDTLAGEHLAPVPGKQPKPPTFKELASQLSGDPNLSPEIKAALEQQVVELNKVKFEEKKGKEFSDINGFGVSMLSNSKTAVGSMIKGDFGGAADAANKLSNDGRGAFKMRQRFVDQLNKMRKEKNLPPVNPDKDAMELLGKVKDVARKAVKDAGGADALKGFGTDFSSLNAKSDENIKDVAKGLEAKKEASSVPAAPAAGSDTAGLDLSLKGDEASAGGAAGPDLDMATELNKYEPNSKESLHGSDKSIWDVMTIRYKKSFYPLFMKKKEVK